MAYRILLVLLFYAIVLVQSQLSRDFTESPRAVHAYVGQSATLTWTLVRRLRAGWRTDFYYMSPNPRSVCGFTLKPSLTATPRYGPKYSPAKVSVRRSRLTNVVGFVIRDLHPEDAQYNYMIRVEQTTGKWIINRQAWIVLYGFLLSPRLTKTSPKPGVFTYTCSVVSSTVMPANIPDELKPTIQYHWLLNNKPLSHNNDYQISGDGNNQLTILQATASYNNNNYTCIAKEQGSWYSASISDVFSADYFPRDIHIIPGGNIVVNEHDDLVLKCKATCTPSCEYIWRKDGKRIATGETLEISSIAGDEPSRYTCEASNEVSYDISEVVVTVHYRPRLTTEVQKHEHYAILACNAKSRTPLANFTWINLTAPGQPSIGCSYRSDTICILNISTDNVQHSALFKCLADNKVKGSPVSVITTLSGSHHQLDPPNGIRPVRIGESASFTIWFRSEPAPPLERWQMAYYELSRPDFERDPAEGIHLAVDPDRVTLSISHVTRFHYGIYRLWWLSTGGRDQGSEKIKFSLVPKDPPQLTVFQSYHHDNVRGSEVILDCMARNQPLPFNMTWINKTAGDGKNLGCDYRNSSHCSIAVDSHHAGIYTCMADNGALFPSSMTITLQLSGKVTWEKVSPANRYCYVRYGGTAYIKVWVKGHPLPTIEQWYWTFFPSKLSEPGASKPDGVEMTMTGNLFTLSIKHVVTKHYGIYGIATRNKYGGWDESDLRFHIVPRDPPKLSVSEVNCIDLMQGSELTLTCIVSNKPYPYLFTWINLTAPGQPTLGCTHRNKTHCSLVLPNVNILDSGTYQCMADNGASQSPVNVSKPLAIFGRARWYKIDPADRTLRVNIGEDAVFKVWIIAQPLPTRDQWHWKFSSSIARMTQPDNVMLTLSGNMVTMRIKYVTDDNYGTYNVWAENKYGGWNDVDLKFRLVPKTSI